MAKIAPDVERMLGIQTEEFLKNNSFAYDITPIADIHLHSHRDWEMEENGNIIYIYVFMGIALLVLIIAGINFMNLSTARSAKRAKEVGIRKVSGATRKMLISQFLLESIIQSFIALFIAFVLLELFIPVFNNIMNIHIDLFNDHIGQTILFGIVLTLVYGLFAGSYPAFFLSSFKPISVLKGDLTKTKSGVFFRKSLVVIQFTASVVLIIGMIIIFKQINFMHEKDLGFKGDQIIVVPIQTDKMSQNFESYKSIFLSDANVINVARSSFIPGDNPSQTMFQFEDSEDNLPLWNLNVDDDFVTTMGMEIIEGRDFNDEMQSDSGIYFLLNETAVRNFNIDNPIGKRMYAYVGMNERALGTVIGVIKDFHIEGFNNAIKPMILMNSNYLWWVTFKISPVNMNETIAGIESKWNELEPSHPFRYTFMDDRFAKHFEQQESFAMIFLYLTLLAIFIAILGLYGLASFTTEQRTKEIGIRKVLGASVPQLINMLIKEFVKLVLLANLIAWPISLILAKNWLSRFSYQIDLPISPFILATVLALIIAILTVSFQAYRAAISEPVNALKYE
jgi:putative ABC transport system permease protein